MAMSASTLWSATSHALGRTSTRRLCNGMWRCAARRVGDIYAHEAQDSQRAVELVMLRDVVQHMDIASSVSAVKKIVLESGATFLATSSYTSAANWTCTSPCKNISTGGFYANDFACPPFSFPRPLLVVPSHGTGPCRNHENDVLAIWRIDTLTSHAKGMHAACP